MSWGVGIELERVFLHGAKAEGSLQGGLKPGASLYGEVQCIIGNGHMVLSPLVDRMTDRHKWKRYLSPTLLVGGNHQIFPTQLLNIMNFLIFLRRWTVGSEGSGETPAAVRPGLWLHFSRSDGAIRSVSDAFHPRNSAQKSGRKWLRRRNNGKVDHETLRISISFEISFCIWMVNIYKDDWVVSKDLQRATKILCWCINWYTFIVLLYSNGKIDYPFEIQKLAANCLKHLLKHFICRMWWFASRYPCRGD